MSNFLRLAILIVFFGGVFFHWWAVPPIEPIGTANGTYVNTCCGNLELQNGLMTFKKGRRINYVVEHDKAGRYILPKGYVGASDRGLVLEQDSTPLKLHLDGASPPHHLELMEKGSGKVFMFERLNGS